MRRRAAAGQLLERDRGAPHDVPGHGVEAPGAQHLAELHPAQLDGALSALRDPDDGVEPRTGFAAPAAAHTGSKCMTRSKMVASLIARAGRPP